MSTNRQHVRRRLGRRGQDAVQRMITQSVQHHLVTGETRPELPAKPEEVESVAGLIINYRTTLLRVFTDSGVRSFTVTVRESMQ